MSKPDTDLTFFTNEENHTLLDRFKTTLKDTQLFDVLVGYFRSSGFYQLYSAIESVEKTRILVGLGIDENSYQTINIYHAQTVIDFDSHANAKKEFQEHLAEEIEQSPESEQQLEIGIKKFIEFLQTDCPPALNDKEHGGNGKKLEIRAYPSRNIHAKVYVGRFHATDRDYGFVITGSSNFSYSGLVANREFNVELRQKRDVEFALQQFENLWKDSVDISSNFVDTIQNKTWLNDTITPYQLYLKLVYEYLQEDINLQTQIDTFLPEGFMRLQYQEQAVISALKKLEEYNGVFLADVVGLGKTFITAQLLQQIRGRILIICPPVLKDYWDESLRDFRVPAKVESLGKLEHIIRSGIDRYDYIVVDEAHRFRNENTQSYADLLDICRGKKIILVTATPLNNSISDIFAQLKLFQSPKNSTIQGIPNLEKFFNSLKKDLAQFEKNTPEYRQAISEVSEQIREKILKHVMVRRTRADVVTYFKKDTEEQGLVFPEMYDPQKIIYQFQGRVETVFIETVDLLKDFHYARYIPLLYYIGAKSLTEFERQQQRNIGSFMKGILIKRLESSFYAFKKSIGRFITSYQHFIGMFEQGIIYISKKVNVYELLDNDDFDTLERLIEEEKAQKYAASDFKDEFIAHLKHDLDILKDIQKLWQEINEKDPKREQLIHELKTHSILKNNKLLIFTESKETGQYLFEHLNETFPEKVIFFSSEGGRYQKNKQVLNSSPAIARDMIKASFDPNNKTPTDDYRLLITTDVLAEGINLHRANTLINYDLPWNPTRVLQRAGRINRLGTQHQQIYIFNFFPTSHADAHLGLEINITNKIQMFHDILGEDARYLSDGEEIGSQELFDSLNNKKSYTGEDGEVNSELKYLEMMCQIRDLQPDLFNKIKKLPKKARSGAHKTGIADNQLVTFFRLGKLKKFYLHKKNQSDEITFFEAANLLACEPDTPRAAVPADYYAYLDTNKQRFQTEMSIDADDSNSSGSSNVSYIEKRLKDKSFRQCKKFTETDDEFLQDVRKMIAQGTLAKKIAQKIKKEIETLLEPLAVLAVLRKHIRSTNTEAQIKQATIKREIILSGYQIKE